MKTRDSRFESLRIFAMFLIVLSHYSLETCWGVKELTNWEYLRTLFFQPFGQIGVDLFVMISGYFLSAKERSISSMVMKDIKLWFKVFYYSIIMLLIVILISPSSITKETLLAGIFPITFNGYWFITSFFILMLIVPMINHFILTANRREVYFLFGIILFTSGVQSILPIGFVPFGRSLNLGILIAAYCFGSFVRVYKLKMNPFISIILLITGLFVEYFGMIEFRWLTFTNGLPPFMVAITIFMLVATLPSFYNRIINWFAASVFALYLIICNNFSNVVLWNKILHTSQYVNHPLLPGIIITIVLITLTIIVDQLYIAIDNIFFRKFEARIGEYFVQRLGER